MTRRRALLIGAGMGAAAALGGALLYGGYMTFIPPHGDQGARWAWGLDVFKVSALLGCLVAVPSGALFGLLAARLRRRRRLVLALAVVGALPLAGVVCLQFLPLRIRLDELLEMSALWAVPATPCALLLERLTRPTSRSTS